MDVFYSGAHILSTLTLTVGLSELHSHHDCEYGMICRCRKTLNYIMGSWNVLVLLVYGYYLFVIGGLGSPQALWFEANNNKEVKYHEESG